MFIENPTRTDDTEKDYLKRVDGLINRYKSETNSPEVEELNADFFIWYEGYIPECAKATVRQHKASLRLYCMKHKLDNLLDLVNSIKTSNCKPARNKLKARERKTSAQKRKSVKKSELGAIGKKVHKNDHIGLRTLTFLHAAIITGLRPSEWKKAEGIYVNGELHSLKVKNGKHTNERAHGKFRTIDLSDLPPHMKLVVRMHLKYVNESKSVDGKEVSFKKYYDSCRSCLRRLNIKTFPRRSTKISLYTGRHQFSADMKRSGVSSVSLAAMMGHAVDRTAFFHYAPSRSGRAFSNLPKSCPEDEARVRAVYQPYHGPCNRGKSQGPRLG